MRNSKNSFDVIIIGAGASGLFAANILSQNNSYKILILNNSDKSGKKILLSGGGRCNITNVKLAYLNYFGSSGNSIKKVIKRFPPDKVIEFFENSGVSCYEEEHTNKIFPKSNRAVDIYNALQNKLSENVKLRHNTIISEINNSDDGITVYTDSANYEARAVLIACGGLSIPKTGSDGSLWKIIENLGHTFKTAHFGLAPLYVKEKWIKELSGISFRAECKVFSENGKIIWTNTNDLLFTHKGLSGPAAMNVARFISCSQRKVRIEINFLPDYTFDECRKHILKYKELHPKRSLLTFISNHLPVRFSEKLLVEMGLGNKTFSIIKKTEINKVAEYLIRYRVKIEGIGEENQAEITAGGIPLNEISLKTMESKVCKNIYFAGEILNVDGIIGGYNFQWAWSSAFIAANGIMQKLNE